MRRSLGIDSDRVGHRHGYRLRMRFRVMVAVSSVVGILSLAFAACSGVERAALEFESSDGVASLVFASTDGPDGVGITIALAAVPPGLPEGVEVLAAYEFGPDGLEFEEAATATIALDEVTGPLIPIILTDGVAEIPRIIEVWLGESPRIAFSMDHFSTALVVKHKDGGWVSLDPHYTVAFAGETFSASATFLSGDIHRTSWIAHGAVARVDSSPSTAAFRCDAVGRGTYTYQIVFNKGVGDDGPLLGSLKMFAPLAVEELESYTLHGQAVCIQNADGTGSTLGIPEDQIEGLEPEDQIDIEDEISGTEPPQNSRIAKAIEFVEGLLEGCDQDGGDAAGIGEAIDFVEGLLEQGTDPANIGEAIDFLEGLLAEGGADAAGITEAGGIIDGILSGTEPDGSSQFALDCGAADMALEVGKRAVTYETVSEECQVVSPLGGSEMVAIDPDAMAPMAAVVEVVSDGAGLRITRPDPGGMWVDLTEVVITDGAIAATGSFAGASTLEATLNGEVTAAGEIMGILTIRLATDLSDCVITANLTIESGPP